MEKRKKKEDPHPIKNIANDISIDGENTTEVH